MRLKSIYSNLVYHVLFLSIALILAALLLTRISEPGFGKQTSKKNGFFEIIRFQIDDLATPPTRIGLFVTALGKYVNFTHHLVETGRHHLFVDTPWLYNVTYVIFTDHVDEAPTGNDVQVIYQPRLGWPFDSMLRPEMYLNSSYLFPNFDYIFNIDGDIYFNGHVGTEILGELVAVWHWYHQKDARNELPYENQTESCAYVRPDEGGVYFSGAVYGGRPDYVVPLWRSLLQCANQDMAKNITPAWHDESYLNRYLISHPPNVILSPSYYCGERHYCLWPYERKILFIIKDYEKVRETNEKKLW